MRWDEMRLMVMKSHNWWKEKGYEMANYLEAYRGPVLVRDRRMNTTRKVFCSTSRAVHLSRHVFMSIERKGRKMSESGAKGSNRSKECYLPSARYLTETYRSIRSVFSPILSVRGEWLKGGGGMGDTLFHSPLLFYSSRTWGVSYRIVSCRHTNLFMYWYFSTSLTYFYLYFWHHDEQKIHEFSSYCYVISHTRGKIQEERELKTSHSFFSFKATVILEATICMKVYISLTDSLTDSLTLDSLD